MPHAQVAVHEAAMEIPEGICARFETSDKLSNEDREVILLIAREALAEFLPDTPKSIPLKTTNPVESTKTQKSQ